jgi:NAD-dependent SIR2 family protein deacetylase
MQKPIKIRDGYLNSFKCSRCSGIFEDILLIVADDAVCRECAKFDEWSCDMCHRAIPDETPHISVDGAFAICPKCDSEIEEPK